MKGALIQRGRHGGESFTQAVIRPRKRLLAVVQCPDAETRFSI